MLKVKQGLLVVPVAVMTLAGLTGGATKCDARPFVTTNLNLSSSTKSITAGTLANFQGTKISVFGHTLNVSTTTKLTPAEAIAVQQVLQNGRQSILLGSSGAAMGGTMTVSPGSGLQYQTLVVPRSVRVINVFSDSSFLSVMGEIKNAGSIYNVATNPAYLNVAINSPTITNTATGLITTFIPARGLPGITPATTTLGLSLQTANAFVNHGRVSSSGNLLVYSAGSVFNARGGSLYAADDITISSGQGSVTNMGSITSANGDISFNNGYMQAELRLVGTNGSFNAPNGNVSISTRGNANIELFGGTYTSRALNMDAGDGLISGALRASSGLVNATATGVHLQVAKGTLVLGTFNGEPIVQSVPAKSLDLGSNLSPVSHPLNIDTEIVVDSDE